MSRSLGLYDLVDSNTGFNCADLEIGSKLCVPYASKRILAYKGIKLANYIRSLHVSSAEECWAYCKRDVRCRAITFYNSGIYCYLYAKNYQILADPFFVTYTIDELNIRFVNVGQQQQQFSHFSYKQTFFQKTVTHF